MPNVVAAKQTTHLGDGGDWTRGLIHAKHALYHWATSPFPGKMYISAINSWCLMIWGKTRVHAVKVSDICCAETQFDIVASDTWTTSFSASYCGESAWFSINWPPLSAGFEPARGDPNGFLVHRLNHSATTTHIASGMSFMIQTVSDRNVWHCLFVWYWRDVHWISKCAQWKISGMFVTDIGAKNM